MLNGFARKISFLPLGRTFQRIVPKWRSLLLSQTIHPLSAHLRYRKNTITVPKIADGYSSPPKKITPALLKNTMIWASFTATRKMSLFMINVVSKAKRSGKSFPHNSLKFFSISVFLLLLTNFGSKGPGQPRSQGLLRFQDGGLPWKRSRPWEQGWA